MRQVFPLRAADSTQQNGVTVLTGLECFFGEHLAVNIVGCSAEKMFLYCDFQAVLFLKCIDDLYSTGDNLGTDAVTWYGY